MAESITLVTANITAMQTFLDAQNTLNRFVTFAAAPNVNTDMLGHTSEVAGMTVDQEIATFTATDSASIAAWIATKNTAGYSVSYVLIRQTNANMWLLATKFTPI